MTHPRIKVQHVLPYAATPYGGPVTAAAAMMEAMNASPCCECEIIAVHHPGDGELHPYWKHPHAQILKDCRFSRLRLCPSLGRYIEGAHPAVVHSHGLWTGVHYSVARSCNRLRIPHIISPCGMLNPEALAHSQLRKRLARRLFQDEVLLRAGCIVAASQQETADIRTLFPFARIATVPNCVTGAPECGNEQMDRRLRDRGVPRDCILFLGRIHPVKGCMRLLMGWRPVHAAHPEAILVMAGPGEPAYIAELKTAAAGLGLDQSVRFVGALDQTEKWAALERAAFLVAPSDFENFCMSIAEGLAVGTPAIATQTTPWAALDEQSAGMWVPTTAEALSNAMIRALNLSTDDYQRMSANARKLSGEFQPNAMAENLETLYLWATGHGTKPAFVTQK